MQCPQGNLLEKVKIILQGIPRKVAVGLLIVTAVGWFFVVIGFGLENTNYGIGGIVPDIRQPSIPSFNSYPFLRHRRQSNSLSNAISGERSLYPGYAVSVVAPIAIICAAIHLLNGIFKFPMTTILTVISFLLINLGILLYVTGSQIANANILANTLVNHHVNLQFAGGIFAIIAWIILVILTHLYDLPILRNCPCLPNKDESPN